jgi:predicted DNA-binding transcriptional regulator AlpA
MKVLSYDDLQTEKGINFSRQWVRKLVNAGKFPRPISLGGGARVAFVESEIDDWLRARVRERDASVQRAV